MAAQPLAIFLSYASQDATAARRLCEALREAGIEVWFDQSELRGGDAWDQKIRSQIRDCALFIPLISANTVSRLEGYFRLEWKLAVDRSHLMAAERTFILPVVMDATADNNAFVPEKFREVQWTRVADAETLSAFAQRVRQLLSPDYTAAPPANKSAAAKAAALAERTWLKSKAVPVVLAAVAALALGFIAVDRIRGSRPVATGADAGAPTTQVAATAPKEIPEKSVAVLAFADLSEKHDQDFFSDGLAEELRDLLAQVPDLKVAARTSSFYFKTHAATIPEIAKSLGVQHLLEGSVRKAGNSIRVTVQLIRADTGFNLWSSTFDRETSDVFKVQDEIANAVVRALQTRLLPSAAPLGARQTSSPEAHDLYLLGRRRYHAGTVESDREAVALFRQATLADPTYAAAFAALSLAEGNLMIDLGRIETAGEYRERIAHAEHAVVLGPQIADGYAVRGITRLGNGEWAAARQDLERAAQLDPNDSQNLRFLARYYASQGELARAIDMVSRAIATDPGDSYARVWRAHFELSDGQNQAARIDLERALQLSPANRKAQGLLAYLDSVEGDPEAALQLAHALPSEAMRIPLESAARCARGDRTSANATFDRWVAGARDMGLAYTVAAYAVCGQIDKALGALEHDIAQPTHLLGETLETIRYHPFFKRLHDQPRYLALIRKVQLSN